ncbi:MAG: ATP-dependent Clp protease ATP-binding subunit, partial [bacterium]|nr:ATP-dependent Clp protease ATP-binding subunit [bacterium]
MQEDFQYNSFRAHKARIGRFLTKPWRVLLTLSTFMLFAAGAALLVYDYSIGWLVASLSVVPAMIVEWWKGELHHIKTAKNGGQLDNVLSGDLLGRLSAEPTPAELATACMSVSSGQFFAARYGIGGRFLQELVEGSQMTTETIWEQAMHVQKVTDNEHVSGSVLLVAIITSYAGYENLIAHLQLSKDDLYAGIRWHEHIRNLIKSHDKHLRTGGIARDWSFGYIPLLSRFGQNISAQLTGNR